MMRLFDEKISLAKLRSLSSKLFLVAVLGDEDDIEIGVYRNVSLITFLTWLSVAFEAML